LIVSIRREILNSYTALAEAAGLKLQAVTPRPFAFLAGLEKARAAGEVPPLDSPNAAYGLLVRGEKWGEFSIFRDGKLVVSRSLAGQVLANDTALLGDLRRNLAIHATHMPDAPVKTIYLAEPDSPGGLRERLQEALEFPVHAYEPLVGIAVPDGPRGGLVGPAGMLALRAESAEFPINFVQPREPKPPRSPHRFLALAGAAVIAVLLIGAVAYAAISMRNKDREIARLQKAHDDADSTIHLHDAELKTVKALDEWNASNVDWLDELYDLTDRVKDIRQLNITSIQAAPIDDRTGKSKQVASMTFKGITTTDTARPFDLFMSELTNQKEYKISGISKGRDPNFSRGGFNALRQGFGFKVELGKRPVEGYLRTFTATPPTRQKDDMFNGFGGGGFQP
jgi:hypothetical protein